MNSIGRPISQITFLLIAVLTLGISGCKQETPAGAEVTPPVRGRPLDAPPETEAGFTPGKTISSSSLSLLEEIESSFKREGAGFQFGKTEDGALKVPFSVLSQFEFTSGYDTWGKARDKVAPLAERVPSEVLFLNEKQVMIVGFMVPIDVDYKNRRVQSFALTQDIAFCCYGVVPDINELIIVQMEPGKSSNFHNNIPIAVFGQLTVGEGKNEDDILSLYQMKGKKVIRLADLKNQKL